MIDVSIENNCANLQHVYLSRLDITQISLWGITSECYHCVKQQLLSTVNASAQYVMVDTRWEMMLEFRLSNENIQRTFNFSYQFGENGSYSILLVADGKLLSNSSLDWTVSTVFIRMNSYMLDIC